MTSFFYRWLAKVSLPPLGVRRSDCWIWTGAKTAKGYGVIRDEQQRLVYAHRASYQFYVGDISSGMMLMHSCDVPACVNPWHLSAGHQKKNLDDMRARQRHPLSRGHIDWAKFWTHGVIAQVD